MRQMLAITGLLPLGFVSLITGLATYQERGQHAVWLIVLLYSVAAFVSMPRFEEFSARELLFWWVLGPVLVALSTVQLLLEFEGWGGNVPALWFALTLLAAFWLANLAAFSIHASLELSRDKGVRKAVIARPATSLVLLYSLFSVSGLLMSFR